MQHLAPHKNETLPSAALTHFFCTHFFCRFDQFACLLCMSLVNTSAGVSGRVSIVPLGRPLRLYACLGYRGWYNRMFSCV